MTKDRKESIALMRYGAIAPVISGIPDKYPSLSAYFREVSQNGILHPNGDTRNYAPSTIEKWLLDYRKGGFDALIPKSRSDYGTSRKIDDDLKEQIRYLKTNYPRLSASAIFRLLQDNGSIRKGQMCESTVLRFINEMKLQEKMTNNQDLRRYELPHINEVWCGDSSVGPYLTTEDGRKHKVYVIALIDDASRFIVGIDVFFNDNFVNLMSVMKSAVSKFGIPKVWNFDNGPGYRNKQMELLVARIGSTIHYCKPYSPVQKAKIERWFRTMKDQWMATLNMKDFHTLDELRGSLLTYVKLYNQRPHTSLGGKSPEERYFSESEYIRRISAEQIENAFLLEIERRVSADSVIVINQVEYEVHYRFAKQKITLRYSPDMSDIYVVEHDGSLTPIRILNKHENASVKREKVRLTGGDD